MPERMRIDRLLVERGLFESRAQAQAAIDAGLVVANAAPVTKASLELPPDADLQAEPAHPFVSRGGVKLAAALDHFGLDPAGRICLDVGASTGGFTDALLGRGAARVYAVDRPGTISSHRKLRARSAVVVLESTDIRALPADRLVPPPSFVVIDVSFISLKLVLPAALALARRPARLIALVKPQFEAGRGHGKKGVIRDAEIHAAVGAEVADTVAELGWRVRGLIASPILGRDGNREFLLGCRASVEDDLADRPHRATAWRRHRGERRRARTLCALHAAGRDPPRSMPGRAIHDRRFISSRSRSRAHAAQRRRHLCPHFGTCGGCALQHWAPMPYRDWKRGLVLEALAQAGFDDAGALVDPLVDAHGEGRRRAVFHAWRRARDVLEVGFAALRAHHVVAIDHCPVLAPSLNGAIEAAWAIAEALAAERKPLDIQVTATEAGLDIDVRGSGPLVSARMTQLARLAETHRLARLTRHGETVAGEYRP